MGPKLARTVAKVVGAVAIFGSACPAAAQNFAADPLSVRMPDDATKADVELVFSVAGRLGVPFGFEAAGALGERVSPSKTGPGRSKERRVFGYKDRRVFGVRRRPRDTSGVTLRQALDAAVSTDRRYEWRYIDGVVVVRPASAWRDPEHPLMRAVSEGTSLFDLVNVLARTERVQWSLRSEVTTVFLDGGRAVDVAQPVLTVGGAIPRTFPLWPTPSSEPPRP